MNELEQEIAAMVAEIAEIGIDDVDPDATLSDIGVDSLMSVEIAVCVEQRYGVHFDDDDLNATRSFADIVRLTRGKLSAVATI
jgi:acyl carrier protein